MGRRFQSEAQSQLSQHHHHHLCLAPENSRQNAVHTVAPLRHCNGLKQVSGWEVNHTSMATGSAVKPSPGLNAYGPLVPQLETGENKVGAAQWAESFMAK